MYDILAGLYVICIPLTLMSLALWLGATAQRGGAWWPRLWLWPGLLMVAGIIAGVLLLALTPAPVSADWVLYSPRGEPEGAGFSWWVLRQMLPILPDLSLTVNVALGLAALGIVAQYETALQRQAVAALASGPAVLLFAVAVTVQYAQQVSARGAADASWLTTPSIAALIALAVSLSLIFWRRPGAGYFAAGGLILLVGLFIGYRLARLGSQNVYHDTYYIVTHSHLVAGYFGIFALFGALSIALRPRLPRWLMALHGAALVASLAAASLPQYVPAQEGMPRRYTDYADAYTAWTKVSEIATLCIAALVILGFAAMVLRRSGPDRKLPN